MASAKFKSIVFLLVSSWRIDLKFMWCITIKSVSGNRSFQHRLLQQIPFLYGFGWFTACYIWVQTDITKFFLYRGLERGQGQYYAQKFIYPQTLLLLLNSGDVYQQNTITSKTPNLPTACILNINNRIFCSFSVLDTRHKNHKILDILPTIFILQSFCQLSF